MFHAVEKLRIQALPPLFFTLDFGEITVISNAGQWSGLISAMGWLEPPPVKRLMHCDAEAQPLISRGGGISDAVIAKVDTKLEIVVIPVSDADRAKDFYAKLGWRLDADYAHENDFQGYPVHTTWLKLFHHLWPERHRRSSGSVQGLYLIVSDIEAARRGLLARGVAVSETFHSDGVYLGSDEPYLFGLRRVSGPDPQHGTYRSFASFSDPDGNGWLFQEITTRLPGRVVGNTTYGSVSDIAEALKRAAAARGDHEKRAGGQRDEN